MTIYSQGTLPRIAKANAKALKLTEFRIGQSDQFFVIYRLNPKGRWNAYPHDSRRF